MSKTEYVFTIYIKTTPEELWKAITNPEFTRQYWGHENISDWKKGSKWKHVTADSERRIRLVGEVLESMPPKRLVLTWADPSDTSTQSEHSRVTFEIEPIKDMVRLRVIHSNLKSESDMATQICSGWPRVLSSMKSYSETGKALDTWAGHEHDFAK